eukprot:gene57905-biopygen29291
MGDDARTYAPGTHVRVHDLDSSPDLNGAQGTIVCDAQREGDGPSFIVNFPPPVLQRTLKASNLAPCGSPSKLDPSVLRRGTKVQAHGLLNFPELNGYCGDVVRGGRDLEAGTVVVDFGAPHGQRVLDVNNLLLKDCVPVSIVMRGLVADTMYDVYNKCQKYNLIE